ncbi:MAG TPA: LamB/YcsF family protein [Polyangiaceae bacterium]
MIPFLNIDAGELEGEPEDLYAVAQAVNIACGGHAGDAISMERVLAACAKFGTRAGAHPSYEDREGFGRRDLEVDAETLARSVRSQCIALAAIARKVGILVTHVKPHGALYHAANRDGGLAQAVVAGAMAALGSPMVVGPPQGELAQAARRAGLKFAREGFADRAMRPDGSLVPRSEPGAVLHDATAVRVQAQALVAAGAFDTLCVHGDSPGALASAREVRAVLDALAPPRT